MKVQFNPVEYHSMLTIASSQEDVENDSDSEESDDPESDDDPLHTSSHRHSIRANPNLNPSPDRSGSPTPRNSPRESGRLQRGDPRNSTHSTLTRHQISVLRSTQSPPPYEPRLVFPALKKSGDLGKYRVSHIEMRYYRLQKR